MIELFVTTAVIGWVAAAHRALKRPLPPPTRPTALLAIEREALRSARRVEELEREVSAAMLEEVVRVRMGQQQSPSTNGDEAPA